MIRVLYEIMQVTGRYIILSVSAAGSHLPVVSYDWLACGTWL